MSVYIGKRFFAVGNSAEECWQIYDARTMVDLVSGEAHQFRVDNLKDATVLVQMFDGLTEPAPAVAPNPLYNSAFESRSVKDPLGDSLPDFPLPQLRVEREIKWRVVYQRRKYYQKSANDFVWENAQLEGTEESCRNFVASVVFLATYRNVELQRCIWEAVK